MARLLLEVRAGSIISKTLSNPAIGGHTLEEASFLARRGEESDEYQSRSMRGSGLTGGDGESASSDGENLGRGEVRCPDSDDGAECVEVYPPGVVPPARPDTNKECCEGKDASTNTTPKNCKDPDDSSCKKDNWCDDQPDDCCQTCSKKCGCNCKSAAGAPGG